MTASGEDETACWRAMRPTLEEIRREVAEFIFAEFPAAAGGQTTLDRQMHHALLETLSDSEQSVRVLESMTRGLVGYLLAEGEAELDEEFSGGFLENGGRVKESRVTRSTVADVAAAAEDAAGDGCGIVVGDGREGVVPIAAAWPGATGVAVATRDVTLVGDPSIHRPLVAKHAMNLLRKRLLDASAEPGADR